MASFTCEIMIARPIDAVWDVLADIGAIGRWNPSVLHSYVTTDKASGVGAGRHCDLGGKNYLDEEVVEWQPGKRLTIRVIGTNLPFKAVDIRFVLWTEQKGTMVTVSPEYTLKFGLLGRLLDLLYVRRTYMKGMNVLLTGLKNHVEKE